MQEKTISISSALNLIPDDEQALIISWAEGYSRSQWYLGRIVARRISLYPDEKIRMKLYAAYGILSGLSARTIRSYVALCNRFSEEVVDRYSPPLPFSHFQFASRFGDKAEIVLQESLDKCTQIGHPPSIEWLEWRFSGVGHEEFEADILSELSIMPPLGYQENETDFDISHFEEKAETEKPITFEQSRRFLETVFLSLSTILEAINRLPALSKDKLTKAEYHLQEAKRILQEIENEIG